MAPHVLRKFESYFDYVPTANIILLPEWSNGSLKRIKKT